MIEIGPFLESKDWINLHSVFSNEKFGINEIMLTEGTKHGIDPVDLIALVKDSNINLCQEEVTTLLRKNIQNLDVLRHYKLLSSLGYTLLEIEILCQGGISIHKIDSHHKKFLFLAFDMPESLALFFIRANFSPFVLLEFVKMLGPLKFYRGEILAYLAAGFTPAQVSDFLRFQNYVPIKAGHIEMCLDSHIPSSIFFLYTLSCQFLCSAFLFYIYYVSCFYVFSTSFSKINVFENKMISVAISTFISFCMTLFHIFVFYIRLNTIPRYKLPNELFHANLLPFLIHILFSILLYILFPFSFSMVHSILHHIKFENLLILLVTICVNLHFVDDTLVSVFVSFCMFFFIFR